MSTLLWKAKNWENLREKDVTLFDATPESDFSANQQSRTIILRLQPP
jgi:hypothetical protein